MQPFIRAPKPPLMKKHKMSWQPEIFLNINLYPASMKWTFWFWLACFLPRLVSGQQLQDVTLVKLDKEHRVRVYVGSKLFTEFLYPDSLEKPVLCPINDAGGVPVTRGFPLTPRPGEPTDHPH